MIGRTTRWIVLGALAGCISKGKHELLEVQLDATRIAMSARALQSQEDLAALHAQLESQTQEIVLRRLQLEALLVEAELRDDRLQRVGAERVALLARIEHLQAQIAQLSEDRGASDDDPEAPSPEVEPISERALAELTAQVRAQQIAEQEALWQARAHASAAEAFAQLIEAGHAELLRTPRATVIRIPTGRLFQEGWTTLSPRGEQIVAGAAEALAQIPGRSVSIEAHTDDRPVHSATFPSNWERGFSRALTVLRGLAAAGAPGSLSATSYAGTRPLSPEASDEQNRRVELVIRTEPDPIDDLRQAPEPEPEP